MSTEKLFENFYGFDKEWPSLSQPNNVTIKDLCRDHFNSFYQSILIPDSSVDKIKGKLDAAMLYNYTQPIDGYTDQDYIDWIKNNWSKDNELFYNHDSWHYIRYIKESDIGNNRFKYFVREFLNGPSPYSSKSSYIRSDKVFRVIELNEFFERAKPKETLKEFLENDSLISDLCKSLTFNDYGKNSKDLIFSGYGDYLFMEFGKNFPIKARKIILELNREELKKVIIDRSKNPLKDTPNERTSSVTFIKDFVDHALGKAIIIDRKVLSSEEIKRHFTLNVIGDLGFWEKHSDSSCTLDYSITLAMSCINESFRSDKDSREFLTYIIDSGVLKDYNPRQILAILIGGCITGHWVSKTSGKDIRKIAMEKIDNNELKLSALLDFISYIICSDCAAVSGAKFDWDLLNLDTAAEWIYSMFPTVKSREAAVHNFRGI